MTHAHTPHDPHSLDTPHCPPPVPVLLLYLWCAQAELIEAMEQQLQSEGVDVKGVTNVMEEMSRRNRELFALPPYVPPPRPKHGPLRLPPPRPTHGPFRLPPPTEAAAFLGDCPLMALTSLCLSLRLRRPLMACAVICAFATAL